MLDIDFALSATTKAYSGALFSSRILPGQGQAMKRWSTAGVNPVIDLPVWPWRR
jgi:hypothetical protein